MTVPGLCKALGRSQNSINVMKNRLKLQSFLDCGDYITLNHLMKVLYGYNAHTEQLQSWVEKRGFPLKHKRVNAKKWRIVYLDEFWEWAEKNKSFINFARLEPLALGKEPDWVSEQRSKDFHASTAYRKDKWASEDEDRLRFYLQKHKYSYVQLSEMLQRSEGAIQRKILDMGLKERPVKAEIRYWSESDYRILAEGIRAGDSYATIGKAVGRSEKAVRGKVYNHYFTECLDKVRSMIGSGSFPNNTIMDG